MLIGICGGIGCGKSVVSRVLRSLGYPVYDCDSEAKRIMEYSAAIKERIRDEISADVTDGESAPDRRLLAEIVFNDEKARERLNVIVHHAVKVDLEQWIGSDVADAPVGPVGADCSDGEDGGDGRRLYFVEAAVLAESGLAEICDRIWKVDAGEEVRIMRVMQRDGCSAEEVRKRIISQHREVELLMRFKGKTSIIVNDDNHSVISQTEILIRELNV